MPNHSTYTERNHSSSSTRPIVVLNVAEKPSVARAIASIFASTAGAHEQPPIRGQPAQIFVCDNVRFPHIFSQAAPHRPSNIASNIIGHRMITTSVRGHLANQDFGPSHGWSSVPPIALFEAPIEINYRPDLEPLERMLKDQAKRVHAVILWLDCDREGEAISDEVRTVCLNAGNPNLGMEKIYRAKFSTLLRPEIERALRQLGRINECFVQAVQARSEHDLRVGAAFTRFQTLRLQKKFDEFANGSQGVISYGPCQFPTLGFVVERWARIQTFVPEDFWYLEMTIRVNHDGSVQGVASDNQMEDSITTIPQESVQQQQAQRISLKWQRERLFDRSLTLALYHECLDAEDAVVIKLSGRQRNKWRPIPLATVELQKRASRYLRIGSEILMTAAEDLYQQGLISYPRTETERFRSEFDHLPLIQSFQGLDGELGSYANKLLSNNNFQHPRNGQHDDNAHPPITPCKAVNPESIADRAQRQIYLLIVKHYFACCSKDAVGRETTLLLKMGSEEFQAKGLMVLEQNWLEIYQPWERWSRGQGELPHLQIGSRVKPSLSVRDGKTNAPLPISEVELISLMDKNQIGTDATIAQHITTIQERDYASKDTNQRFQPTKLGIALIEGYNRLFLYIEMADLNIYQSMGYQLNKPDFRRKMESECNLVAEGRKSKDDMMRPILQEMKLIFQRATLESHKLDTAVARHFTRIGSNDTNYVVLQDHFSACGMCGNLMSLKQMSNVNVNRHGDSTQNTQRRDDHKAKVLSCVACSIGLLLPSRGLLNPLSDSNEPTLCPICNYQVISISEGDGYTGSGYTICPKCFSDSPAEFGGSSSGDFRCFSCIHSRCRLAGGVQGGDIEVFPCPFCRQLNKHEKVTLKKNSRGYVLSCSGRMSNGERCTYIIWLPNEARSVSLPEESVDDLKVCRRCTDNTRTVLKVKFVWKPGSIPPYMSREHIGCVLCDDLLKTDMRIKLPQLNQVQRNNRHGRGRRRVNTNKR